MGETIWERQPPPVAAIDHALRDTADACFWLEEVADRRRHEPLTADHRTDLVVVGGGYTGLWTAIRAKQRDPARRVQLLEAARLGWAASGRNGGFCAASLTHGADNGRARWPAEYDDLERLGEANLAGIAQTVDDFAMAVDWEPTGELTVAVEEHQVAWLRESGGRFLDRDEVRAVVDSPVYLAGVTSDDCALLHPGRMVAELARVASDLGVEIVEDTRVTGLESDRSGPVRVRTRHGTVIADRVALATNAFPALLRRERLRTVPVYDYAVMTEPLTAEQRAAIGWHGRQGVGDAANQFHYYRLSADDRILFGGYDAVYRFGRRVRSAYEHRPASYRRLVSHLLTTFPQLEGIRVSHRWGGAIDTSTRFCAFWARGHGGRVAHAAGFTGLGVGASRFAGDVLLDLLSGEETERTALEMVRRRPLPFPPEPAAALGIHATRWSLDRADHREGRRNLWLRGLDAVGLGFDS
jgi:glycine/D-amino acid oxidase-like deaminating enzyme